MRRPARRNTQLGSRNFVTARVDGLVMLSTWAVTRHETALWTTARTGLVLGLDLGVRFFSGDL